MHCEHFMRHPVATASLHDTIAFAARVMRDKRIGMVPIVDDAGCIAGTVTERDIVNAIGTDQSADTKLLKVAKPAVVCAPRDTLEVAEKMMVDTSSHYVVVCDEVGKPLGVIGCTDLARDEDPRRAVMILRHLALREGAP